MKCCENGRSGDELHNIPAIFFARTKQMLTLQADRQLQVICASKITVLAWHTVRSAGESFFIHMANKESRSIKGQIELLKQRSFSINEDLGNLHLKRNSIPQASAGMLFYVWSVIQE